MNNKRRKQINKVKKMLLDEILFENALDILENILAEEEDSYYSIPENLLYSKRAETSEMAIDYISNAIQILSDYVDNENKDKNNWKKISNNTISELLKIH